MCNVTGQRQNVGGYGGWGTVAVVCGTGYASAKTCSSSAESLPCICDGDRAERGADMSRAVEGLSAALCYAAIPLVLIAVWYQFLPLPLRG